MIKDMMNDTGKILKRYEAIFESVQDGILTIDTEYIITSANKFTQKWIDVPINELIFKDARQLFHDKGGICPHCVAKNTFEAGGYNSVTQSSGLNFAELSSYPIVNKNDQVVEAVVFIHDITERVLYEEEIMGLYNEVTQTKEYMESLIVNSADAIVTYDLIGIATSWNAAAEETYGFKAEDAIGKFMPFVPESLVDFEKENIQKIRKGQVMKLETYRQKVDGSIIEVSLTMSPIKNLGGEVIGISTISRDISDKKRVEKELIRRNQELSRLFFISSAMRGTLELDKMLRMVLTAVTMSDGLGFNRAILFFVNEDMTLLKGEIGMGPADHDEAWAMWEQFVTSHATLREIMLDIENSQLNHNTTMNKLSLGIEVPITDDTVLGYVVRQMKPVNVLDVRAEPHTDMALVRQLKTKAFAAIPLVYRGQVIGVLWVDNMFNQKLITEDDMKFLTGFMDHVASAIESARLFQKVSLAEAELENIFRSISDMVYITDKKYTIINANQAVLNKLGLARHEVIGQKCYKIFHGMDEPFASCPHHHTVDSHKPYMEEIEDPYLNGTYLASTSPSFDPEGELLGTVHVLRDISEINIMKDNILRAERELSFRAAHKLGNPLYNIETEIQTFKKMLIRKGVDDHGILDAINLSLEKAKVIIMDLKSLTKTEHVEIKEVDIMPIIENCVRLPMQQGVKVIITKCHEMPMILADPYRLTECLDELISNALVWLDKKDKVVTVILTKATPIDLPPRLKGIRDFISIKLSDNGVGISVEMKERIFDPFFTERKDGTGLGLAIVKRNIEAMGGYISEIGSYGKGAIFEIALPIASTEEDSD